MMEQEYGVVMAIAQVAPEWFESKKVARTSQELLWIIEEVFVEHDDAIDDQPTIEDNSGVWSNQEVDVGVGIRFAQGTQGRRGEEEVADACHFDDQDACVFWKGYRLSFFIYLHYSLILSGRSRILELVR